MGRFFKSVKEQAMRERSMFDSLDCGPIRGHCHDDGVPISVDGEGVGHLIQQRHRFRRKDRTMRLVVPGMRGATLSAVRSGPYVTGSSDAPCL
jgi:hypothetical protein